MANVLIQPVSGSIDFNEQSKGSSIVTKLSSDGIRLSQVDSSGLQVESHFGGLTGGTRFSVAGDGGQLLSITDSLTGDIFSVNDASGLPIINVNSCVDDVVKIGTHTTNALVVSAGDVSIGTDCVVADQFTVGVDGTGVDVKFHGDTSGSFMMWDQSEDSLCLTDSTCLKIGDGDDVCIYHDGSNSKITHTGSGGLYIGADTFGIQNGAHNETYIDAANNGAVNLYHNNSKKLETTSGGSKTTGSICATNDITADGDGTFRCLDISNDVDIDGTLETDALSLNGTTVTKTAAEINAATDCTGTTTASNSQTFSNKGGNISQWTNDSGYTTCTGDITGVTAGTGITGGGSSGGVTVTLDLDELTTSTSDGDGDFFAVVDSSGNQKKLTKGNIAISGLNNDSGFTNCTGTITGVTAGTLLDGGGSSGGVTLNVDLTELADMTQTWAATDEFVVLDGGSSGTQKRKPACEITISTFNNDSGFTTCTGDITGVTAGSGLTGGGSSGGVTVNVGAGNLIDVQSDQVDVDLSELTDMTQSWDNDNDEFVVLDGGSQKRKLSSEIFGSNAFNSTTIPTNNNQLTNGAGFTTCTGDITSVVAGTLLDGGATSGDATLNVDLSELSTSTSNGDGDFFVVVDSSNNQKKLTKGNINISEFNNNSGFTTCTGDITGVTAGTNLNGGGSSGSVTVNLDGDVSGLTSLVVDTITLNGDTISTSGNGYFDAEGDITLDANGADIFLSDNGTNWGLLANTSSNLVMMSRVNDKDIIFKGYDNSSAITALTLDMSDAGTATFNHNINLPDSGQLNIGASADLYLTHDDNNGYFYNNKGDLFIDQTANDSDIVFKGTDNSGDITALRLDMSDAGKALFNNAACMKQLCLVDGSPTLILQDNSDDDDHHIQFINNSGTVDYEIRTQDPTSGGGGDGLYIGSCQSDGEVVIFTNDAHALTLAANQRATFADEVCMGNSKLVLNGTAVNSTAAELNLLDGCSSAAGIACTGDITGVTAGTNLNGGGSSGSVTVNLDGDVTGLTSLVVDDITINGSTISDSGDLTIDAAGQLNLDSGNSEIHLKGSGTTFGKLYVSGSDFYINNPTQDEDIVFSGNDGGSSVTALRLDMSNGGAASFNNWVCVPTGSLVIGGAIVTATPAELNLLDGFSSIPGACCVGDITGVTAGTNLNGGGSSGSVTVNLDGDVSGLTSLVVDDITINGSTISDGGDFTLDIGGDLTIDAGGGNIYIKDDGTTIGEFFNSSSDFVICSKVSNKDMIFCGNDNGTARFAMCLDMSDNGTLITNSHICVADGKDVCTDEVRARDSAGLSLNEDGGNGIFIKDGGNVAIGSTTANNKLQVCAGTIELNDNSGYGIKFGSCSCVFNYGDLYVCQTGAGNIRLETSAANSDIDICVANASGSKYNIAKFDGSACVTDFTGMIRAEQQINAQTGTTYTFVLADHGKLVTSSNGSAQTLTVPPNSSVAYPIGADLTVMQLGSGQVTIAAGSGVTLYAADSELKTRVQYSAATLTKVASDAWLVAGDLTA